MNELLSIRERFKEGFVSELPDGTLVPWKLLSVKDYFLYEQLKRSNQYLPAYLENEIFQKCVLDEYLKTHLQDLKAGVVTTVANTIYFYSTPRSIEDLNELLDIQRLAHHGVIHDLACIVLQAFPSYKPEEVYAMDIATLVARVALAERKQMRAGIMVAPIVLEASDGTTVEAPLRPTLPPQVPVNQAKAFKEQKPVQQTIITKQDALEIEVGAYTGHEKEDKLISQDQMIRESAHIYQEYINQLQSGKPLAIKTDEERKAAYTEKVEQGKRRAATPKPQPVISDKQKMLERLAQERKEKKKKAAQRK